MSEKPTIEEINEIYRNWFPIHEEAERVYCFCMEHSPIWREKKPDAEEFNFVIKGEFVEVFAIYTTWENLIVTPVLFPTKYLFASRNDILSWLDAEVKEEAEKIRKKKENLEKQKAGQKKAKELKLLAELKKKYEEKV